MNSPSLSSCSLFDRSNFAHATLNHGHRCIAPFHFPLWHWPFTAFSAKFGVPTPGYFFARRGTSPVVAIGRGCAHTLFLSSGSFISLSVAPCDDVRSRQHRAPAHRQQRRRPRCRCHHPRRPPQTQGCRYAAVTLRLLCSSYVSIESWGRSLASLSCTQGPSCLYHGPCEPAATLEHEPAVRMRAAVGSTVLLAVVGKCGGLALFNLYCTLARALRVRPVVTSCPVVFGLWAV